MLIHAEGLIIVDYRGVLSLRFSALTLSLSITENESDFMTMSIGFYFNSTVY